jgi:hypothetical protein
VSDRTAPAEPKITEATARSSVTNLNVTDILRISVPLTAWLAAFSAVYGLQGLVCSDRWAEAGLDLAAGRIAMTIAWATAVALQFAFLTPLRFALDLHARGEPDAGHHRPGRHAVDSSAGRHDLGLPSSPVTPPPRCPRPARKSPR